MKPGTSPRQKACFRTANLRQPSLFVQEPTTPGARTHPETEHDPAMPDIGKALVYYLVFLFSTTVHEAAHAWAALLGGDPTAYHGGQVSLDPRAHIRREPMGMLVIPLLSALLSGWPMGFASAPYDPGLGPSAPAARRLDGAGRARPANLVLVLLALVGDPAARQHGDLPSSGARRIRPPRRHRPAAGPGPAPPSVMSRRLFPQPAPGRASTSSRSRRSTAAAPFRCCSPRRPPSATRTSSGTIAASASSAS